MHEMGYNVIFVPSRLGKFRTQAVSWMIRNASNCARRLWNVADQ